MSSTPGPVPTVAAAPPAAARRARVALAALFFANGAVFANAVPRYPDLKADLELSNTAFGTAVAGYGLGALVLGLAAGWLIGRWTSARVAPASTILLSLNIVLLGVAPSWWALAAVLFLAGSLDSIADIAVNAQGLRVERRYRRSILNGLHAVWSIGAVTGGAMGATAAGLDVPLGWHLSGVAVLFGAVGLAAARFLLPGPDGNRTPPGQDRPRRARWRLAGTVGALGVVAGSAQLIEDVGATWSAVYLRVDLGTAAAAAGLGFITLQATQTVGRLLGDRLVTRYGDRTVARVGAVLAGVPMLVALAVPSPVLTICAFGAAGAGIGTLIPAALRTVDELPGLPPGVGLTLVGLVTRLAILVAPPVVGVVADATSLRVALLVVPLVAATVLALSAVLSPARGTVAPAAAS